MIKALTGILVWYFFMWFISTFISMSFLACGFSELFWLLFRTYTHLFHSHDAHSWNSTLSTNIILSFFTILNIKWIFWVFIIILRFVLNQNLTLSFLHTWLINYLLAIHILYGVLNRHLISSKFIICFTDNIPWNFLKIGILRFILL